MQQIDFCRYFHISCSIGAHRGVEDDRDRLIEEDDVSSTQTERIMMSNLSQASFTTASTFIIQICIYSRPNDIQPSILTVPHPQDRR